MNLAACLNSADIHVLRTIAKRQGMSCRLHSKNDLIQTILEHFQNEEFVFNRLINMHKQQQNLLTRLVLDRKHQFTREDLLVAAEKALGTKIGKVGPEGLWTELVDAGWIYRSGTTIFNYIFQIPEDIRPYIKRWMTEDLIRNVSFQETEPTYYREDGFAMVRDLERFLQFIEQHEVRLTTDGTIFKRLQQQLFQLFEIQEDTLAGDQWRFGYGRRFRDYPDRFALIYDFCFAKGWITEDHDGVLRGGVPAETWNDQTDIQKIIEFYLFWEKTYSRPIPQLHIAAEFLAHACKQQWTTISSIARVLNPYIEKYYYDTVETIIHKRLIQMLRYLGMVQTGGTNNQPDVVKLTSIGRFHFFQDYYKQDTSDGREWSFDGNYKYGNSQNQDMIQRNWQSNVIVQPNLEILVGAQINTRIDREINRFAELIQSDTVRCYQMTEESVKRFLKNGNPPEQLLTFLKENSNGELPTTVEQRVRYWADGFGKIRSFQATLLECEDENIREEILKIPGIMKYIDEVIGDRYILIAKGKAQEIMQSIELSGKLVLHE